MKQWLVVIVLVFAMTLAGCGNTNEQGSATEGNNEEVPQRLEVELTIPETAGINEDIPLEAKVTQGDEAVNDASEVKFEVTNLETEESQSYEGELTENGMYSATIQIQEPGNYSVISHVTARDLHTMPSKEMVVEGEGGNPEAEEKEATDSHSHGVAIHFSKDDPLKSNKPTTLSAHIEMDGNPVSSADVTFEIWKDGAEKHNYVDAEEVSEGMYELEHTFPESGSYIVQVHVKSDVIHDHQEYEVNVE